MKDYLEIDVAHTVWKAGEANDGPIGSRMRQELQPFLGIRLGSGVSTTAPYTFTAFPFGNNFPGAQNLTFFVVGKEMHFRDDDAINLVLYTMNGPKLHFYAVPQSWIG